MTEKTRQLLELSEEIGKLSYDIKCKYNKLKETHENIEYYMKREETLNQEIDEAEAKLKNLIAMFEN
jgi:uncharacterized coiled-coil DUF342 family protein